MEFANFGNQRFGFGITRSCQLDGWHQIGFLKRLHQIGHRPSVAGLLHYFSLTERSQHQDRTDALSSNLPCCFDAIETMKRALLPMHRPELTLPGLKLLPTGGFVTQTFEQTTYACWRQIRLDNARAHLATTSLDVVCETLGCTADFGPAYQPDDRPFVERFFGSMTTTLARRLPGGIDPANLKLAVKRLRDPKDSLQLLVTAQELEELLAMTIWNYHGTPHAGLGGLTPLEAMHQQLAGIRTEPISLRRLHPILRKHPQLLHDPVLCRVRGNLARGERAHISYLHVRYTSDQLTRRPSLLGEHLRVHVDPTDLRTVLAEMDMRRPSLARMLGLPEAAVRVTNPDVGGGFGMKAMTYPEYVVIAQAARMLGRAVDPLAAPYV